MKLASLTTPDGRRAWAFAAIVGGAVTMTLFAAVGVYLVRNSAGLSFWLALAAHGQVALCLTGLIAMFVKRRLKVTRDGFESEDTGDVS